MHARPGEPFEALLVGASPGLAGTMRVEVYDPTDGAQVLAPTVVGVTEPRSGAYRAMLTVPTGGSFLIRWTSPDPDNVGQFVDEGEEELTVDVSPVLTPGVGPSPSVDDVGALLRARTKTRGGGEIGTFTADTRPTASEVAVLIDEAVEDVTSQIGLPLAGSPLEGRARRAAALYAAVLVETSYFPEQVAQGRSAADTYLKLYTTRMKALVAYVAQGGDDPENADGGTGAPEADLSFTTQVVIGDVVYGQAPIGWGTRWR